MHVCDIFRNINYRHINFSINIYKWILKSYMLLDKTSKF